MKIRSFRTPRPLLAVWAQGRGVLRGSWSILTRWPLAPLAVAVLAVILTGLIMPHDASGLAWLHSFAFSRSPAAMRAGYFLGTWGDYPTYNFPLAIIVWIHGWRARSSAWRRIAVVCFLGSSLAGIFDDCFRLTLGRPRPDAHVPDGFYGLNNAWHSRFQSFPSGHAAAVFGTACALMVAKHWLGWLTTIFALLVVWARMEIYRHYPSDVVIGSLIGISFGLLVGFGSRARRFQSAPASAP